MTNVQRTTYNVQRRKQFDLELTIHGKLPAGMSENMIREIIKKFSGKMKLKRLALGLGFVSARAMAGINQSYRGKASPTDVLSFGYALGRGNLEGDILICPSFAKTSSKEQKVGYKEELKRLLIHGLLHLARFDHVKKAEAERMFKLQERILKIV